jgi:hypothetical protein
LAIPTTLQASLMARLDRLAPVREVAQIGAVAGREFHYELLYAVAGMQRERQLGITAQFGLLCAALLLRNEPEAALEVIDHGHSIVNHNSERFFEAELYRLKARALLMRGARNAEVESLFDQALRTARSQQARSLELRAATDLARLWINQGKRAEARDILASIYGRFNEGFDTRDLKDAKCVLAQLQ